MHDRVFCSVRRGLAGRSELGKSGPLGILQKKGWGRGRREGTSTVHTGSLNGTSGGGLRVVREEGLVKRKMMEMQGKKGRLTESPQR